MTDLELGRLNWSLTLTGTTLRAAHFVPPDEYEPGIAVAGQANQHSTRSVFVDATLSATLGLSDRLGVDCALPVRSAWQQTDYFGFAGETLPDFHSIHHQDGWTIGLGDISLGLRGRVVKPSAEQKLRLDLRAGVSLPTGGIEPDPDALARQGLAHNHLFFGTGTFDPQLGLDGHYDFGAFRLVGSAFGQASLYSNRLGYRQGARGAISLGPDFSAGLTLWRFQVMPEVYHEEISAWGADRAEGSGRTDLLVAVGVTWFVAPGWFVNLRTKVPIHTWAQEDAISLPWFVQLSVGGSAKLWDAEAP